MSPDLKKTLELNLPIATRLSGTLLQTDNSDSLLSKNHHQLTVLLFHYAKERINQKKLGWKKKFDGMKIRTVWQNISVWYDHNQQNK